MRNYYKDLLLFSFLLLFLILPIPQSILSSTERDVSDKRIVHFAFISLYNPREMYERYQPLMDYLSSNTPYRFELKLGKDYRAVVEFLKNGSAQIALLGAVTCLDAQREFNIVPILTSLNPEGEPTYKTIFITRSDNTEIKGLADLKGKSLALASKWSTSGNLVPLYYLYRAGMRLKDLSNYTNLKYHDTVAREVLKGNYDAGAVIDSVAMRYQKKGLKFIFISDPIPGLPIVVRSDATEEFVDSVKKALLALNPKDPEHMEIMGKWGEEVECRGFYPINHSHCDRVRQMLEYLAREGVKITP